MWTRLAWVESPNTTNRGTNIEPPPNENHTTSNYIEQLQIALRISILYDVRVWYASCYTSDFANTPTTPNLINAYTYIYICSQQA